MEKIQKEKITYFLRVFGLTAIIIIFGSVLILVNQSRNEKEAKARRQIELIENDKRSINEIMLQIKSDIGVLSSHSELKEIINLPTSTINAINSIDQSAYNALTDEFKIFAEFKKDYRQIRYIDETGQEIVRINRDGQKISATPTAELSNKRNRYYFIKASQLSAGDIYLSKLDLNVENNIVEVSYVPTLRIATPVFSDTGKRKGIIILNYNAQNILSKVATETSNEYNTPFLLNSEGYWLLGYTKDSEWSFMFPEMQQFSFESHEPEAWQDLLNAEKNGQKILQAETDLGFYTFGVIDLKNSFSENINVASDDAFWINGSFVSATNITSGTDSLQRSIIATDVILLVLFGVIIYYWSNAQVSANKNRTRIKSINEVLTLTNKILRHDLANKFTAVKLTLEDRKSIQKKTIDSIRESAEEGIEIIQGMRSLEQLTHKEENEIIALKPLLERIVKRNTIPITIKGKDLSVKADSALYSVFRNLIENAKTHGKTKKITITISQKNNFAEIAVKDFGKGISDDIKHRLFEEGFSHGETGNTGIGLFIVKKNIQRYNGTITIKDTKPSGATFIITLPLA
jgi:signal transduction histidine kinase